MDHVTISNLPIFWLLAGVTVLISALQTILYIREAKKQQKFVRWIRRYRKKRSGLAWCRQSALHWGYLW